MGGLCNVMWYLRLISFARKVVSFCSAGWTCHRPHVAVTVSPLVNTSTIRSLVVSWSLETVLPGDHVVLYVTDAVAEPLFRAEVTASQGWLDTGVQENRTVWESLAFTDQCLGYWAALRGEEGDRTQGIPTLPTNQHSLAHDLLTRFSPLINIVILTSTLFLSQS